jgi:hypothetical protein
MSSIPEAGLNMKSSFDIPNEFICPISCEIMSDPVVASDGHTYERKQIETWFRSHAKSPKTNQRLDDLRLVPNIALRNLIREFKTKNNIQDEPLPPPSPQPNIRAEPTVRMHLDPNEGITMSTLEHDIIRFSRADAEGTARRIRHLVDHYSENLVVSMNEQRAQDEREAVGQSSPSYYSPAYICEIARLAKTHTNDNFRRESVYCLEKYANLLNPSLSSMDRRHVLETVFSTLIHCSRSEARGDIRALALSKVFSVYTHYFPEKTNEMVEFYHTQLVEEGRSRTESRGVFVRRTVSLPPSDECIRECIRHLAACDERAQIVEARAEYRDYMRSSTHASTVFQSLLHYGRIPDDFADILLEAFNQGAGSHHLKLPAMRCLLKFRQTLLPNQYESFVTAMINYGKGRCDIDFQWEVLSSCGEMKDARKDLVAMLIDNLQNLSKGSFWWNCMCTAAGTSLIAIANLSSGVEFPEDTLQLIRSRKMELINLMETSGRHNDVPEAASMLLHRIDSSISIYHREDSVCAIS